MISIQPNIFLNESEIQFSFMASPGPGGQNVNKVASGVLLRFNVLHSTSLPEEVRQRLMILFRRKITKQGDLLIKATRHRTQERNREEAIDRLIQIIKHAAIRPKKRKKTKPTAASVQHRLNKKKKQSVKKLLRRRTKDVE